MESRQGLKFSLKLSLSLFFTSFTFCMCKHKTTERAKDTKLSQRHCGGRQVHPWRRLRRPTLSVAIWNGCQHLLPLVVVRTKLHTTVPTTLNFFILPLRHYFSLSFSFFPRALYSSFCASSQFTHFPLLHLLSVLLVLPDDGATTLQITCRPGCR